MSENQSKPMTDQMAGKKTDQVDPVAKKMGEAKAGAQSQQQSNKK